MPRILLKLLQIGLTVWSLFFAHMAVAQKSAEKEVLDRLFMPSIQMGYINHNSVNISEGLIIQTSLEYRSPKGWLFRVNYDDFTGRINANALNTTRVYSAQVPLKEVLGGLGYRIANGEHNVFFMAQSGLRFYELPVIKESGGQITVEQLAREIVPIRYTLGYEFELIERFFLNTEVFIGHFAKPKDYWQNKHPFWGFTLGLSTGLF